MNRHTYQQQDKCLCFVLIPAEAGRQCLLRSKAFSVLPDSIRFRLGADRTVRRLQRQPSAALTDFIRSTDPLPLTCSAVP
ncbi:hypothetical protein, partial [Paracoccus luteus]|uniref:hypothetical protein n=1 Tax=Paracoccus luteus TaxID=2508543 RepID=UPI001C706F76